MTRRELSTPPIDDDRVGWPIALGLVLSLLIHAGAGVLLVRAEVDMSGAETSASKPERRESPAIVELGEPDSEATTITWIGYTEYEEHLARKSETEQALQTPDDTPLDPIRPDETVAMTPSEPAPESSPTEEPTDARPDADEPEPALAEADEPTAVRPVPAESASEPVMRSAPSETPPEAPIVLAPDETLVIEETVGPPDEAIEREWPTTEDISEEPAPEPAGLPMTSAPTDRPAPSSATEPADEAAKRDPQQQKDGPRPESSNPSRAQPVTQPVTQPAAVPADREAVATAIKRAEEHKAGKPLASKGLRIRTVRPELSHYTALFARYRAPVARIFFGRDGRVVDVVLLRESGNEEVDRNTLDALFRWRAEGALLEQLEPVTDPPPANRLVRGDELAVGVFSRLGRRTVAIDIEILP